MSGGFALIGVFSVLQLQFSLEPEPVAINCTAFNHNGNLLVTGAADGVIRLFGKVFFGDGGWDCMVHIGEKCFWPSNRLYYWLLVYL